MTFTASGRLSDSPYVDSVWQGQATDDQTLMCPADGRWNLRIAKLNGKIQAFVEGSMTRAVPKTHVEGIDWLVIKFKIGAYMPCVPARDHMDSDAVLPEAGRKSFWLHGSTWQFPNFENADTFVDKLVRDDALLWDPVVNAALGDSPPEMPLRTLRHHFSRVTGLTRTYIRQIEQARQAAASLEKNVPILDVVYQMGYADQAHMTRSLKRFMGYTPVQIPLMRKPD